MRAQLVDCLDDLALLRGLEGMPVGALELAAAADLARKRFLLRRPPRDEARWQARVALLRQRLPAQAADDAAHRGRAWNLDQTLRAARERASA